MQEQDSLREQALKRLQKKSEFQGHVLTYVLVNALLIVIWATMGAGYFWPVFPLVGWGIGIAFHAWDVYRAPPSEAAIEREIEKLRRMQ